MTARDLEQFLEASKAHMEAQVAEHTANPGGKLTLMALTAPAAAFLRSLGYDPAEYGFLVEGEDEIPRATAYFVGSDSSEPSTFPQSPGPLQTGSCALCTKPLFWSEEAMSVARHHANPTIICRSCSESLMEPPQ